MFETVILILFFHEPLPDILSRCLIYEYKLIHAYYIKNFKTKIILRNKIHLKSFYAKMI